MKMRMKKKKLFALLLILVTYVSAQLPCLPDSFEDDDDYWPAKDYSNADEGQRGYLFRYIMRNTQYDDWRSGLSYKGIGSLCYEHNSRTPPNSQFRQFSIINSVPATITNLVGITSNLKTIWNNLCFTRRALLDNRMHIPINFHAFEKDTEYVLKIRVGNRLNTAVNYEFKLYNEYWVSNPSLNFRVSIEEIPNTASTLNGESGEIVTIVLKINGLNEVTANNRFFSHKYYLERPTNDWTVAYTNSLDRPNIDLLLVSSGEVGIATVEMTHKKSTVTETSYCGRNSCEDTCPCIENSFCVNSGCTGKCQPHCNTCSTAPDCTSCFPTSVEWAKLPSTITTTCVFDFMDITKYALPIELDAPPAIHWRFTIEFWTFIHKTDLLVQNFDIIYKDFLSVSMNYDSLDDLKMFCVPIEWLYPIDDKLEADSVEKHLNDVKGAFYLSEIIKDASAKWIYTRCGFNFDNNKSYMNDQVETDLRVPQMYVGQTNYPWQLKKFYKQNDKVKFIIQYPKQADANANPTNIYLRNINIYREYIPQTILTKYFNVHKLTLHEQFPQLLFSIPLDDVTPPSPYTYQWYDYFDRTIDGATGLARIVNTNTIELTNTNLVPGRMFKRLNFLDVNTQYSNDCDMQSIVNLRCLAAGSLCFETDKPYVCPANQYLDTVNFQCNSFCPSGFMHHPDDTIYQRKNYCTAPCDYNSQLCPDTNLYYQTIKVFACKNNFFDIYYKCYSEDRPFNKANALQFSKDLNTHSIVFDLTGLYQSFVLEAWIYPDLRFEPPDTVTPLTNTIFMTDVFRIDIEVAEQVTYLSNAAGLLNIRIEVDDYYVNRNWNHFIFSADYRAVAGNTEYFVSFRNNIYEYFKKSGGNVRGYRGGTIRADMVRELKHIYFCNRDKDKIPICDVDWINAYYREIKIWDTTDSSRYAIFNSKQFENSENMMAKHRYTLHLADVAKNSITDKVGTAHGYVPFATQSNQNPDNESMFNYEAFFAYDEVLPGDFITNWTWNKKEIAVTRGSCGTGCAKCYALTRCLSCLEGYSLHAETCEKSKYVYKNPSKNMPNRLALKIKQLSGQKYVTFFFFLKLYGFTKTVANPQDRILIIFDDVNNLLLAYNPNQDGTLEIQYNGDVHFSYPNFNRDNMGHWIPISISAFRQYDTTFTLSMTQASIKYTNLQHQLNGIPMASYALNQFIITNKWIGLLSDLRIYNYFIPNAWGLVKYDTYDRINKLQFQSIPLQSETQDQCLQASEIDTVASGLVVECFADYNPHWLCPGNKNRNYLHWDQGVYNSCGGDCGSVVLNDCLGNDGLGNPATARYPNQVCDNRIIAWSPYILQYNNNHVICRELINIDFARFKKGTVQNIESPPVVFSIDFWFYYQTYVDNPLNFKSITFIWNFHIKIEMEVVFNSGAGLNRPELIARCYPVIDKAKPANDPSPNSINFNNARHMSWVYISCGVNNSNKKIYLTNSNKFQNEITYTPSKNLIPTGTVTFSFLESSKSGFGIIQMRQLRLWKCYSCSPAFRNFAYVDTTDFASALHMFDTGSGTGFFFDSIRGRAVNLVDEVEFEGYNIVRDWGSPLWCSENNYDYYRDGNAGCDRMFNLARLQNFQFTVPSSRTSRYTIGFWFFVESAQEMTNGMNIIWENHMSISLIRDSTQSETIVAVCFPQAYRDKVDGKTGLEIFDVYDSAVNKDKFDFTTASSKWNYVQCGVDLTRKLMYINDQADNVDYPETDLLGELLYGDVRNYRPFRYFSITETTPVKFQNAKENLTRIFFRSFRAYIDFIPQQIKKIKYFDLDGYVGQFWPLVMYVDFVDYSFNCQNCNGLHYITTQPDGTVGNLHRLDTFLNNRLNIIYTTYPDYYVLILCTPGQSGGDSVACGGAGCRFCYHDTATEFFYSPTANRYLNLETLTPVNNCAGYTRLPDANTDKGFCLLDCSQGTSKINTCAEASNNWPITRYSNQFTCVSGYSRVYYECLEDSLVKESSMYFSNYFSFNNIKIDHSANNVRSYYFEVWFKFDMINFGDKITKKLHYLLAPPHLIIHDPNDQLFKYANTKISSGNFFYLLNLELYEWNRIIIKTLFDPVARSYSIDLYLNYDFVNPEVSIKNLDGTIYDMTFQGIAFCNQPFANCDLNSITYNTEWGTAWYKNLRLWEEKTTSLELIQTSQIGYTQLLKSQLIYFHFSIDSVRDNTIRDKLGRTMDCRFWYRNSVYDNDTRENTSINTFDLSYLNPGKYINGITQAGDNYILLSCSNQCKRCYSSVSTNCYECENGYALIGKECKPITNYYLKTPPNSNVANIQIKTNPIGFTLSTQNPITVTFWMKFFGITQNAPVAKYYPIITFFSTTSFIGYNIDDNTFVVVINSTTEIFSVDAQPYIGKWSHFGLSIHRTDAPRYPIFPHMVNFMVNQQVLNPIVTATFEPETTEINIDRILISTVPIAYFFSLSFYKNYWFGTYGHVNAVSSTRGVDLIYQVKLVGTSIDNCIVDDELDGQLTTAINPICVADYNSYDDTLNECGSDFKYIDLTLSNSPPCGTCNSICLTQCYQSTEKSCSSNYKEGLYWITTQDHPIVDYYSQRIDNVNFANYNSIKIPNLQMVKNDEMSLEFWVYIYQYKAGTFTSLDVIWDKHLRLTFSSDSIRLTAFCYPYTDIDNLGGFTENTSKTITFKTWTYIRCAADRFITHLKYYLNGVAENSIATPIPTYTQAYSSLTIQDNTPNLSYGFSFIREIKLFSSYCFTFWLPDEHNLTPSLYGYLLHYFKNTFDQSEIAKAELFDKVQEYAFPLTLKSNLIGYNYVKGYKYLKQCNEGDVWNAVTEKCVIFNTPTCRVAYKDTGECLICAQPNPYLDYDNTCSKDCGPNRKYPDDKLMQCRNCDTTCFTCDGKEFDKCLSCTAPRFYVPDRRICVLNCEDFGLTPSVGAPPNTCVPFNAEARILNYDITQPILQSGFNLIEGQVYDNTASPFVVEWEFHRVDTTELNRDHRNFANFVIPLGEPFTSNKASEIVSVDPDFFMIGFKYVFNLWIHVVNQGSQATVIRTFVFIMNDYPIIGKFNVLPNKGYLSNNFLITCNKCTDDNTDKADLLYQFSYMTVKGDKTTEVQLQAYSSVTEIFHQFTTVNANNEYYLYCYCKDKMGIFETGEYTLEVYDIPNNSGQNIPVSDMIGSMDLDEILTPEQLNHRAEFLYSMTIDFPNEFTLSRTTVTSNGDKLSLADPHGVFKDSYCNRRGPSYVIDKFLYCDCENYNGKNCQVDGFSYKKLLDTYILLYTKIKEAQTVNFDAFLLDGIHKLIKSGAFIMNNDNMNFMLQGIDFVVMFIQNFPEEMVKNNNHRKFLDIYNSLVEYGLIQINHFKMTNFIEVNSKLPTGLYDAELVRGATMKDHQIALMKSFFNRVKTNLKSTMKFYIDNKFAVSFTNTNINLYIALINENFSFENFFSAERSNYEPYFDVSKCLSNVMKNSYASNTYKIFMLSVIWKVSPYLSEDHLYSNTTSPFIEIDFYDFVSFKQIYLTNCGLDSDVELYFPIDSYTIPERVNNRRKYISPENQFDMTHEIFNDPVYIDEKGEVFNSTPTERITEYFVPFNFSCTFYESDGNTLSPKGCDYSLFTDLNYIQCKCIHLTDFVPEKYEVSGDFNINSRFFYLKHYMLLAFLKNYYTNPMVYIYIALVGIYILVILIYSICDCYIVNRKSLISYLKTSIVRIVLPYRNKYEFSEDLHLEPEIRQRLEGGKKRNPDLIENNIGINNIDVMIMADNIAKYDRKLNENEKNLKDGGDFFNPKNPEKNRDDQGKFFRKNNNYETESGLDADTKQFDEEDSKQASHTRAFYPSKKKTQGSNNKKGGVFGSKYDDNDDDDNDGPKGLPAPPQNKKNKVKAQENKQKGDNDDYIQDNNVEYEEYDDNTNTRIKEKGKATVRHSNYFENENTRIKQVNPFQEMYTHYNPNFGKPKVISKKLDFYDKDLIKSEKSALISEGVKKKDIANPKLNKEAEIKVNYTENQTEMEPTLGIQKEELPKLPVPLTKERRLFEFNRLGLDYWNFFKKNIKNRYILNTTFGNLSICYQRYKRIGNFVAQIALCSLILSVLFTADAKLDVFAGRSEYSLGMFVLYCLIAEIVSCLLIHLPSFFFYIDVNKFRPVYETIRENRGLKIMKDWKTATSKRFWWNFLGVFTQWIYILISFYFSFCFCATYAYQADTFFLGIVLTIIIDWLIFEFIWEAIIGMFYQCRGKGRFTIIVAEFLNRTRTMKTLT